MSEERKKDNGKGAPQVVPWERLALFVAGKGEATLMRVAALGCLGATFLCFIAAFVIVMLLDVDGYMASGFTALVGVAMFFVFRWLWVQAREVRDDELYDAVIAEQPAAPRPQPQAPRPVVGAAQPAGSLDDGNTIDGFATPVAGTSETQV